MLVPLVFSACTTNFQSSFTATLPRIGYRYHWRWSVKSFTFHVPMTAKGGGGPESLPMSVSLDNGECNPSEKCNTEAAPEPYLIPSKAKEKEILDKQLHFQEIQASFFSLYRYVTWLDLAFVIMGTISALIAGGLHPTAPVSRFH